MGGGRVHRGRELFGEGCKCGCANYAVVVDGGHQPKCSTYFVESGPNKTGRHGKVAM